MADIFGDDDSSAASKNNKAKSEDFGAMLEASYSTLNASVSKGDKVSAEILTIGRDDIFVSVKGKDGVVPRSELQNAEGVVLQKVGDQVDLYVVKFRDGLIQLTAKASSKALSETIEDAFDFETPIDGTVTEVVNGGFRVSIHGKLAFCPISQMDSKQITAAETYVGKKFDFIVTKFEKGGRNIVVSRRKVLDQEKFENQGAFLDKTKVGDVVTGTVSRIEAYGAFIRIAEGIEGLAHISEISWTRLAHPSERLQLNDKVSAKVIKVEEDEMGRLRLSVSLKQVEDDPWVAAAASIKSGASFTGRIKEKERFGFLIEIAPGVVGLLPKSALKESLDSDLEQRKIGESIRVIVNSIDSNSKKVSLGLPREQEEYNASALGQTSGFGTLGDKLKGLSGLKLK